MRATYFNSSIRRGLDLVENKTTDLADDVLKVPLDFYRDADLRVRERDEIMLKSPIPLVTSAEIPEVNDYMVRDIFGKSVLLVRGQDGVARVFENYCRHRGSKVAEGCGNRQLFTCPYHAWSFDTAGQLKKIPGVEGFPNTDMAELGLIELPSEEFGGLVWAVLTRGQDIDISQFLGADITNHFKDWGFHEASFVESKEFSIKANWKAAVENFGETYHFQTVHGQSIPGQINVANTSTHDAYGLHHMMCFPMKSIVEQRGKSEEEWNWAESLVPVYWIFPSTIIVAPPGIAQIIQVLPTYSGADDETLVRSTFLTFEDLNDPQGMATARGAIDASWEAVYEEDRPILIKLGEAVRHSSQETIVVGRNEVGVQHMIKTIAGQLQFDLGQ